MCVYTACFILNYIFFIEKSDFAVVKQRMFYFRRFVFMYLLDKKKLCLIVLFEKIIAFL